MSKVISPVTGRVVWFRVKEGAQKPHAGMSVYGDQPMAAQVAYVWSDRMVNLVVTDHAGNQWPVTSVTLRQPEDVVDAIPGGYYAEWMPYQVGQAKAS